MQRVFNLKLVINFLQYGYYFIVGIFVFATILCFWKMPFKKALWFFYIISFLSVIALYFKIKVINLYLKYGKYTYEFLYTIKQLNLLGDIKINMEDDFFLGAPYNYFNTNNFLRDNNLKYINRKFIGYHQLNPSFLAFSESDININNNKFSWGEIDFFNFVNVVKFGSEYESKKIIVHFINKSSFEFLFINNNSLEYGISELEFRLLFIHFTTKYKALKGIKDNYLEMA